MESVNREKQKLTMWAQTCIHHFVIYFCTAVGGVDSIVASVQLAIYMFVVELSIIEKCQYLTDFIFCNAPFEYTNSQQTCC